jgi:type IV secretion system protein VirB10
VLAGAPSITLDRLPTVDPAAYAGFEDDVDWYWKQLLVGAAV